MNRSGCAFHYSFQGYADSMLSELDVYKTSCSASDTAQLLHSVAGIDMYTSFLECVPVH